MKINLTAPILGPKNLPLDPPVQLRDVLANALLTPIPRHDDNLDNVAKDKLYRLWLKVEGADEIDVTAEQVSLLKDRVARTYVQLIVGRVNDLVDPQPE